MVSAKVFHFLSTFSSDVYVSGIPLKYKECIIHFYKDKFKTNPSSVVPVIIECWVPSDIKCSTLKKRSSY